MICDDAEIGTHLANYNYCLQYYYTILGNGKSKQLCYLMVWDYDFVIEFIRDHLSVIVEYKSTQWLQVQPTDIDTTLYLRKFHQLFTCHYYSVDPQPTLVVFGKIKEE